MSLLYYQASFNNVICGQESPNVFFLHSFTFLKWTCALEENYTLLRMSVGNSDEPNVPGFISKDNCQTVKNNFVNCERSRNPN